MVTRALIALAMLVSTASAEPMVIADRCGSECTPPKQWSRLGTRIAYGALPVDGELLMTASIGVSMDRPLYGKWRWLGEYEYLWVGRYDAFMDVGGAALPDSGHRVQLGVRRRFADKTWAFGRVGLFVDGEAGGGAMLVDHLTSAPLAFAGVRAGLQLANGTQIWDYELVVRGLALPDGPGVLFGIGMVWGQ